jgi:hypothetical protein
MAHNHGVGGDYYEGDGRWGYGRHEPKEPAVLTQGKLNPGTDAQRVLFDVIEDDLVAAFNELSGGYSGGATDLALREQEDIDSRTPTTYRNQVVSVSDKRRLLRLEEEEREAQEMERIQQERRRSEEAEMQKARDLHTARMAQFYERGYWDESKVMG